MIDLLTNIGHKFDTDKAGSEHNFTEFYDKYFNSIRFDIRHV